MGGRAVIFDLDGTLLDTLRDLADSMNRVFERKGLPVHPVDSYRYFAGRGVFNLVRNALGIEPGKEKRRISGLVEEFNAEYNSRWDKFTEPYPGVPEMLSLLEERKVPKGILSNKHHPFVLLTVGKLLSSWSFNPVYGVRVGYPIKPDPSVAISMAELWGIKPESILYLGDSNVDMETARRAGMIPLGASWGFRTKEELSSSGAAYILERPEDLIRFI